MDRASRFLLLQVSQQKSGTSEEEKRPEDETPPIPENRPHSTMDCVRLRTSALRITGQCSYSNMYNIIVNISRSSVRSARSEIGDSGIPSRANSSNQSKIIADDQNDAI